MDNTLKKEKQFRIPRKLDTINWARFVRKLFDLAYKYYGTKPWAITQEKIGDNIFYRTELTFEKITPLQWPLQMHKYEFEKVGLFVEPFSYDPKELDLELLYERMPKSTILVTCRESFWDENLKRIEGLNENTGKILIPLRLDEIQEANRKIRRGTNMWFDNMLSRNIHSVIRWP